MGIEAQQRYRIVIGNSQQAAHEVSRGIDEVREYRLKHNDAFHFNWSLHIEEEFQQPFMATQENMAALDLRADIPKHQLAANLRRAFSGVVAGNVKPKWVQYVQQNGPYQMQGDPKIMAPLDKLLRAFVAQKRMKLPGSEYIPCYQINGDLGE